MKKQTSLKRVEAPKKLTGKAKFIDDLNFPDMLYGATVRSTIPRGKLKGIRFGGDIPWHEFTIVTSKDIPGGNFISIIEKDWPVLVDEKINHLYEAIALIAHPDKHLVQKALKYVELDLEEWPAVFNIDDSLNKKEIIRGEDNILKSYFFQKGNVDDVWHKAAHIVEGTYETGAQEQLYIENHGMIAMADPHAGVTVWGSMQCPYYIHGALCAVFDLPKEKVRIIQTETGGGFGGKEDYPSLIAAHTALLAHKAKKPVKIMYSRTEDLAVTTKRHPSKTYHRTAVDKDGKLLAMDIYFKLDGGAYTTVTPVVLSRGTLHSFGPYFCENIRVNSVAVATNSPPHGAFRGFGAPQSVFAIERHFDHVAFMVGLTPEEFRRRNFIKEGQTTATGQVLRERVDFDSLLTSILKKSDYHNKLKKFEEHNKKDSVYKKGIGFATFMHGAGFTGSGEKYLASIVGIQATDDKKIRILSSSTEMGQGKTTIFTTVAAEALGISPESIEVPMPDTAIVPNSGPTVASRTSMVVGKLVEQAAESLKQLLIASGYLKKKYTEADFWKAVQAYKEVFGELKAYTQYQQPSHIVWDDKTYHGDAYPTYAWAVYAAEVTVNTLTYETRCDHFWATQEIGRVLNPILAEGQIQGGVAQGVGFAIYEKVIAPKGGMINNQMTNYIIPTASDIPQIDVYFEEWNKEYGPGGAKGIGELPLDGSAPAVINAVCHAIGKNVPFIPALPEDLMNIVEGA